MATTGTATIDFGAMPGSAASVTVTGQSGITAGAYAEAFLMAEASADHNAEEHALAAEIVGLTCGDVIAGTGFTIYARTLITLTGAWKVRWVWS
jgi:hypothetical protein